MTSNFPKNFSIDDKVFFADFMLENQFTVRSVPKSYRVLWDESIHPMIYAGDFLKNHPDALLLVDEVILKLYGHFLDIDSQRIFSMPASEDFKSLEGVAEVVNFLQQHKFSKGQTLLVMGGGVTQDLGSFVSACYKRGISWINFPTTLLSMSDSCIGGKASINFRHAKNQLALFSTPTEVIIHPGFLATLPDEMIRSGLSEILKIFTIGGNEFLSLYNQCVLKGEVIKKEDYKTLIMTALNLKRLIVEADEFEANHRRSLNYGHTLGHAIESLSQHAIPHGLAVAMGMYLENKLSHELGLLEKNQKNYLNNLCYELLDENEIQILQNIKLDFLLDFLKQDKKGDALQAVFALPEKPGKMSFVKLPLNAKLADAVKMGIMQILPT